MKTQALTHFVCSSSSQQMALGIMHIHLSGKGLLGAFWSRGLRFVNAVCVLEQQASHQFSGYRLPSYLAVRLLNSSASLETLLA